MKIQQSNLVKLPIEDLIKATLTLKVGDIFDGEIVESNKNSVLLKLVDGTKINAQIQSDLKLEVGKTIKFLVQSANDNQTVIRPYKKNVELNKKNIIENALKAADLPVSEQNIKVLNFLINNHIPINKESVEMLINKFNNKEKIPLAVLKFLVNNNMPIEKETIKYIQKCVEYQEKFNKTYVNLIEKISERIVTKHDNELLKIIFDDEFKEIEKFIKNNLDKNIKDKKDTIKTKQKIKQDIVEKFFVKYNDLNKLKRNNTMIKDIYDKINKLQKCCEGFEKNDMELEKAIMDTKSQFQTLQNLNKDFISYQIPLQFSNQLAEGFLYMIDKQSNKGKKNNSKSTKTAVLSLNMLNLGHLNIFISIKNKLVNCIFNVEKKFIKKIVQSKLNDLKESVEKKGYLIDNIKVNVLSMENLIQPDLDKIDSNAKQYSFDMRV